MILKKIEIGIKSLLSEIKYLKESLESCKNKDRDYEDLKYSYNNLDKSWEDKYYDLHKKREDERDATNRTLLNYHYLYVLILTNYTKSINFIPAIKIIRSHMNYRLKLAKDIMDKCCEYPATAIAVHEDIKHLRSLGEALASLNIYTKIHELSTGNFVCKYGVYKEPSQKK